MALIELYHNWLAALETQGKVVRIIFLDFQKAFDRVDHHILLNKLANTGMPNFLITWITSFLCERQQRVKVGDVRSEWTGVNAGVPQGTLIGPVTFLLHINDLKTVCESEKYVDDASIWEVCDRDGEDSQIQEAADQAALWSNKNNMRINVDKTKEMTVYFGTKKHKLERVVLNGKELEEVTKIKSLGVWLNNNLTWHDHVDYMTSKASTRLYFLCMLRRVGIPPQDIYQVYTSVIQSV